MTSMTAAWASAWSSQPPPDVLQLRRQAVSPSSLTAHQVSNFMRDYQEKTDAGNRHYHTRDAILQVYEKQLRSKRYLEGWHRPKGREKKPPWFKATDKPEDKKPANKKPANKKPGNKKPANKKPANKKPANKKSANKKSAPTQVEGPAGDPQPPRSPTGTGGIGCSLGIKRHMPTQAQDEDDEDDSDEPPHKKRIQRSQAAPTIENRRITRSAARREQGL